VDWVQVGYDGKAFEGQVEQVDNEQVCVRTFEDELFWYEPQDVQPIPLTEEQLLKFGFEKSSDPALNGTGQVYIRGPFVLKYADSNNNKRIILVYMGDHTREINDGLTVPELQHHYHGMTKILLERP
jgi:hypothetical protein